MDKNSLVLLVIFNMYKKYSEAIHIQFIRDFDLHFPCVFFKLFFTIKSRVKPCAAECLLALKVRKVSDHAWEGI